jgi:hypothetical protein
LALADSLSHHDHTAIRSGPSGRSACEPLSMASPIKHRISMKLALFLVALLLTGCAAPKHYSYDHPDAATILLSQTSDFSMSKVVLWGMQLEQVEPKRDEKLGEFTAAVSTRIYRRTSPEKQFIILSDEEYGTPIETFKMPPGKYRISSMTIQRVHGTGMDAMSLLAMARENRPRGPFSSKTLRTFPEIVVDLKLGSVNYIGSFRAYLDNCNNLMNLCGDYRIEIRDALSRDAGLLKIPMQKDKKIVNQTLKIDRRVSPYFYSVD